MEGRSQFTFYNSFYRSVQHIKTAAVRCKVYDAICEYALFGKEPDLASMPDAAAAAFEAIRPVLTTGRRKAESGKSGGSAKQTGSKAQAN